MQGILIGGEFRDTITLERLWPPPLEQIIQFVGYMSARGLGESTAKTYLSGISYYLKLYNYTDVTQNFIVRKLLSG